MNKEKNIYYVYGYKRGSDSIYGKAGTFYYIGKGKEQRAYSRYHSIKLPKDKKNIEIIKYNLSEKDAHDMEIYLIKLYGRLDLGEGVLRNLTNGGEGTSGYKHTQEANKRNSERQLGEKSHMFGKKKSEETKEKLSMSKSGKYVGVKRSEESKNKQSDSIMGAKNHQFGKPRSEETKKLLSDLMTGIFHEIVNCPHCNQSGGIGGMKRYHFNNCKTKVIG